MRFFKDFMIKLKKPDKKQLKQWQLVTLMMLKEWSTQDLLI